VVADLFGLVLGATVVEELTMPSPTGIFPQTEDEGLNLRLWAGMLLPPLAGGGNIIVGYIVSNYDCNVHNRRLVLLVNVLCFALCSFAAWLAWTSGSKIETARDDPSANLRRTRSFLRQLGLWFAGGFAILVLAGTVSTLILSPCDL
jgi:hypothetical protein